MQHITGARTTVATAHMHEMLALVAPFKSADLELAPLQAELEAASQGEPWAAMLMSDSR